MISIFVVSVFWMTSYSFLLIIFYVWMYYSVRSQQKEIKTIETRKNTNMLLISIIICGAQILLTVYLISNFILRYDEKMSLFTNIK